MLVTLAFRNLWRNRRRTLLTLSAMVVSAALLILALGVFSGMFRRTKFSRQPGVKVIQHRGELIGLPVRKLAQHTIIRQLMGKSL